MSRKKTPVDVAKVAKKTVSKAKAKPEVAAVETSTPDAVAEKVSSNKGAGSTVTGTSRKTTRPKNTASLSARQPGTLSSGDRFVGPPTDELKEKFSAQKIPLQTDFSELIDVADCGRKAVGLSPAQPGGVGAGLKLDDEERLAVLPGNGIDASSTGVGVTVEPSKGLSVSAAGIAVRLEANKGLTVGANGVAVQPGTGITVDSTGVSIASAQLLVAGMIMMFSGSVAPDGWAFCDGAGGRPDLRNRFILGGAGTEVNTSGGATVTGAGGAKVYSVNTNDKSAGAITVTVSPHALTAEQMPTHTHLGGIKINHAYSGAGLQYGAIWVQPAQNICINPSSFSNSPTPEIGVALSSDAGGNQGHTHANSTATQGMHNHNITALPAYYVLAFIIKL